MSYIVIMDILKKSTKIFSLIIFFLLVSVSFLNPVFSQENENSPEITPSESAETLANENGLNTICFRGENVAEHTIGMGSVGTQKFNIVTEEAVAGVPIYVVLCSTKDGELICTTTDPNTDLEISDVIGGDNSQEVSFSFTTCKKRCNSGNAPPVTHTKIPSFTVDEGNPYIPTSNSVKLSITMSSIVKHAKYPYYGLQIIPPITTTDLGTGGEVAEGHSSTPQQGTFGFTFEELFPEGSEEKCIGVSWDPFGRVFDSKSLEPIEGVEVKILDSINPEHYPSILDTSLYTDYDGVFNFMVPEGTYYLRLGDIPSTHQFTDSPNLNPNYMKIYVKPDGSSSIYSPDEPIKELIDTEKEEIAKRPVPEQRDIPLDPGENEPYKAKEVVEYKEERASIMIGAGDMAKVRYSGRVSHPFARVDLVGDSSGEIIASNKADRQGFFQILVSSDIIPIDETLDVLATPTDLTRKDFDAPLSWVRKILAKLVNFFIKNVSAEEKSYSFEPILRYIEGFAYGPSGMPIKNAEVTVKLKMNDSSYYKTTADSTGYFAIASNHLPPFNFYLKLTDPVTRVTVNRTTSDFVRINQEYLEKENIDLMKYKTDKENLLTNVKKSDETESIAAKADLNGIRGKDMEKSGIPARKNYYNTIVLMVFLIILLIAGIVGMVIFIRKNREKNINK